MPLARNILCVSALIYVAACDKPHPLAALPKGETGRVVRIIDGDALVLNTGLTVRLSGIEAPALQRRDRPGAPYADSSMRLLEDLAMGRQVRLYYPGLTRDRYDRALAYVETEDALGPDLWLNLEMIKQGGARARLYPDTAQLGEHLIAAEAIARQNKQGLWALAEYSVQDARHLTDAVRGFLIVEGTLGVSAPADAYAICTRRLVGADLSLSIQSGAAEFCSADAPRKPLRIRGYVREGVMEVTHWMNVESLTE